MISYTRKQTELTIDNLFAKVQSEKIKKKFWNLSQWEAKHFQSEEFLR